ncbi:MAG: N-acetyltransferase [Proteobacteria bacterium]|jgi:amino-acid N-acetyltransferase|nr:N-acetyltransferase [Pseudomonadota bacterium]
MLAPNKTVVRIARHDDINAISALITFYAELGNLLPRSIDEISQNLEHFLVATVEGEIAACASFELFTPILGEIRSLMVSSDYQRQGIASNLIKHLIDRAQNMKVKQVMALTYIPKLFHQHGFRTVDKSIFPEKVWGICVNCYKFNNCDEIAVLLEL